ncbi:MAG: twin-arginine translocase TatA/TatE family subunit [Myxococcota bacterium]
MFGIGPMELIVIVVVALLIFGPQRLPEFARTLGKGLAEFRRASNELRQTLALDELENDLRKTANQIKSPPPPAARPAQAGDALPPGTGGAAAAAAGAGAGAAEHPESTGDAAPPAEAPPWKDHPGQLPEGGDHDHHETPASASGSGGPEEPPPTAPPRPAGADPGLGNVPVGGGDPTETRRG